MIDPPDRPVPEPVRLQLSGADSGSAMGTLPGLYAGKHWHTQHTDAPYRYRYGAAGDHRLSLRRSQMTGFLRGNIPPSEDYVVQWIDAGESVVDVHGEPIPQALHQPLLFPPDRDFVFTFADYDQRLVHLDRDLVHDVAAEQYDVDDRDLRFDHRQPPSHDAVLRWRRALATASSTLRDAELGSLAWHEVTRQTAAAFLALYPPILSEPLPPALLLPKNARLRRAVDHLHANPHLPMTVADVAAVADLSIRALQDSFQRVFDTTPMAYLRDVRLTRVRDELLQLDPAATTVAEVARRWGFTHLGRFSGLYLARYGEYPKDTLRR
ncbi:hypothetical protein DEJ23_06995 [Curtobacterium sp. MCSS17_008]|uniref:AraC family transcriptional regulator n=1 Tax=Curtobacterium sp. MCSS17_008 TaxID=2175647 RepID=UPI000DAA2A4D|nr:helix-turn-helix transcriptional regulator [Curtobacterium sp. MCSS17_008]PZF57240.1 hypothetical protein DEJ23_06995 [Curtobacterium sp. MCSS17_008]